MRDAPAGNYTVETKLTIDFGLYTDKSFQQAGLVAYEHDDLFVRLDHVAVFNTRQTEFLKEEPYAGDFADGAMAAGTPTKVTWLRIAHKRDIANGEHEFRAASSRDGKHWTWAGVWTLPPEASPRIGLVSLGGTALDRALRLLQGLPRVIGGRAPSAPSRKFSSHSSALHH